jgi:hypothetical protein
MSDIRSLEPLDDGDQHYTDDAIIQHTSSHGFLYQAVIVSSEVFLQFSSTDFTSGPNRSHIQQFFSNEGDALTWLQTIDM